MCLLPRARANSPVGCRGTVNCRRRDDHRLPRVELLRGRHSQRRVHGRGRRHHRAISGGIAECVLRRGASSDHASCPRLGAIHGLPGDTILRGDGVARHLKKIELRGRLEEGLPVGLVSLHDAHIGPGTTKPAGGQRRNPQPEFVQQGRLESPHTAGAARVRRPQTERREREERRRLLPLQAFMAETTSAVMPGAIYTAAAGTVKQPAPACPR